MSNKKIKVPVVLAEGAEMPLYASLQASGADIKAHLTREVVIQPGQIILIPTGLRFAIPEGFEIQVRPRSGLAVKHGITVLNSPGTIDADYRGELQVILINNGKEPFTIVPGMRIAQIVLVPVYFAEYEPQETLAATSRANGGFGHTGL